jgi:hypothetical protein
VQVGRNLQIDALTVGEAHRSMPIETELDKRQCLPELTAGERLARPHDMIPGDVEPGTRAGKLREARHEALGIPGGAAVDGGEGAEHQ